MQEDKDKNFHRFLKIFLRDIYILYIDKNVVWTDVNSQIMRVKSGTDIKNLRFFILDKILNCTAKKLFD